MNFLKEETEGDDGHTDTADTKEMYVCLTAIRLRRNAVSGGSQTHASSFLALDLAYTRWRHMQVIR